MFVKTVSVFSACSAQGRVKMYSQAAELLCRNEKICSHRTRKWYSWLLVWKEELFSPTLHGRLCSCPWMSAHASLLNKHIPHLTWQADMSAMKAGCLLIGKQGYPDLGANYVKLRRSCWVWVYYQLWDMPSVPEKSGVRMVWFSWLVSEDLIVWDKGPCFWVTQMGGSPPGTPPQAPSPLPANSPSHPSWRTWVSLSSGCEGSWDCLPEQALSPVGRKYHQLGPMIWLHNGGVLHFTSSHIWLWFSPKRLKKIDKLAVETLKKITFPKRIN